MDTSSKNFKVGYNIHCGAAIRLLKIDLKPQIEAVIYVQVTLPIDIARADDEYFTSYFASVKYVLKRYATDSDITSVSTKIVRFKWDHLKMARRVQQIWTNTLLCRSTYTKKMHNDFLRGVSSRYVKQYLKYSRKTT